jgi:hypothetical protein
MQSWFKDGFLPADLPVRRETDTEYIILRDLRRQSIDPNSPFRPPRSEASKPHPTTQPSLGTGNPSLPLEIPHALFVDLTKPASTKEFPATELSKSLIESVGLDVVCFRRNHQVAYRIVDQCRQAYDRINGVIDEIDHSVDDEANYIERYQYKGALDALEQ